MRAILAIIINSLVVLGGSYQHDIEQNDHQVAQPRHVSSTSGLAKLEGLLQEKLTQLETHVDTDTENDSLEDSLGQLSESADTLSNLYALLQEQAQEEPVPVFFQKLVEQTIMTVNKTRDVTAQFAMNFQNRNGNQKDQCKQQQQDTISNQYTKHLQTNPKLAQHLELHKVFGGQHSSSVNTKLSRLAGGNTKTKSSNRSKKRRNLQIRPGFTLNNVPQANNNQPQTNNQGQQQQQQPQSQPQQNPPQQQQQQQNSPPQLSLNNIPHASQVQPHQTNPQLPKQSTQQLHSQHQMLVNHLRNNNVRPKPSAEPSDEMEHDCIEFVECVREYTLYDFLVYFAWDAITDDGKIPENANVDAEFILDSAEEIMEALEQFKDGDELEDTEYLPQKCNGMLRLFHRNEEHDRYQEFEPAQWKEVCDAKKNSKYLSFEGMKDAFGDEVAGEVFEDLIVCTERLMGDAAFGEDSIFFDKETNMPRLPVKFHEDAFDRHGQLANKYNYYEFGTFPVFDERFPCIEDPHKELREKLKEANEDYLVGQTDTFKAKRHEVEQKIDCEDEPEEGRMTKCTLYLNDEEKCDAPFLHPPEEGDRDISSAFWHIEDKDDVAELLVGKNVPAGSVCGVTEPEAFCCLDLPLQNSDAWGTEFDCSQGEDGCQVLAPPIAGFSESVCNMFSGIYCKKRHACERLKDCIEDAKSFAEDNNMAALKHYLEDAPEIEDVESQDDCAEARLYFGFDEDPENDDDTCNALERLKDSEDFERLDQFLEDMKKKTPEVDEEEEHDKLDEPPKPEKTEDYYAGMKEVLYRAELNVLVAKDFFAAAESFDCAAFGEEGSPGCASIQNAVVATILFALGRLERAYLSMKYNFAQEDLVSDYDTQKMYNNIMVINGNQKKLFDLIDKDFLESAKSASEYAKSASETATEVKVAVEAIQQSLSGRRMLVEDLKVVQYAGCDGQDQDGDGIRDNCEEDNFVPTLEVPSCLGFRRHGVGNYTVEGSTFTTTDMAVQHLKESLRARDDCASQSELDVRISVDETKGAADECSMLMEAVPVHVGHCNGEDQLGNPEWFNVSVDRAAPVVKCGFRPQAKVRSSSDGKTMFLEQQGGVELVDSGLFFEASDNCHSSLQVDIAVSSNELTRESTAMLARTREPQQAKLFVAPQKCDDNSSKFCVPGSVLPTRYYDVKVSATDDAGWTSSDTCRVVIVSNSEARELRGTQSEYESAQDTTVFNIDSLSLRAA